MLTSDVFIFSLPVMWFVVQTCIRSELRLFQPNDIRHIRFSQQWLHLALLFVTVQPIFQSTVSKGTSANIRSKTSVSLISSSPENDTCLFVLREVELGGIPPLSAHCLERQSAGLWTALHTKQIFEINSADRSWLPQAALYKSLMEIYDETHIKSHSSKVAQTQTSRYSQSSLKASVLVETWRRKTNAVPPRKWPHDV